MFSLTPDAAVWLLTAGIALIWIELNRPGVVIPGAVGLLMSLLAFGSLARLSLRPWAVLTLLVSVFFLARNLRRRTPVAALTCGTASLLAALRYLTGGASRQTVSWFVALPCALFLGIGTTLLTTIARHARQNKGLDLQRARSSRPEPHPLDP